MGLPVLIDPYLRKDDAMDVPAREENQYIAYDAAPTRPFWRKKGSLTNWLPLWLIGLKALRALRLEYLPIPTAYIQTASWYPGSKR